MVFVMKLNASPFEKLKTGRKTVELRLYDQKRRTLNIDDYIIFTNLSNTDERIAVIVKALYRFGSFADLFSEISPAVCGNDDGTSPEEAALGMRQYYSEELEKLYGVLGIRIEQVDLDEAVNEQKRIEEALFERFFPDGMK